MALLNKDGYYNLSTFAHNTNLEYWPSTLTWQMRKIWDPIDDEYDYYYLEFKGADAFDIHRLETFVNPKTLERVRNREIFLMIVNFHEGFLDIVEGIYQSLVIRDGYPPEQIILGTGNYDIPAEVTRVANLHNLPEIRVEMFLELEYALNTQREILEGRNPDPALLPDPPMSLDTLRIKDYKKKFLNFNRRWRLHRPTLVALMKCYDLLKYGHVSLGTADDRHEWAMIWAWMNHTHKDNETISKLFMENQENIFNIPKMYLDTPDLITNRAWLDTTTDYLYNETYFSVVTETNYYTSRDFNGGRYITEKTFKAIACEHPFLLVTCPNSLPILHDLGYKTFHPYIDESYDQEYDDSKRLVMIVEEIKRLCELKGDQLVEFLTECKKIVNHNLDTLRNKKVFVHKANYK